MSAALNKFWQGKPWKLDDFSWKVNDFERFSESGRLRNDLYSNARAMDVLYDISEIFENFIFLESKKNPGDFLDFDQKS